MNLRRSSLSEPRKAPLALCCSGPLAEHDRERAVAAVVAVQHPGRRFPLLVSLVLCKSSVGFILCKLSFMPLNFMRMSRVMRSVSMSLLIASNKILDIDPISSSVLHVSSTVSATPRALRKSNSLTRRACSLSTSWSGLPVPPSAPWPAGLIVLDIHELDLSGRDHGLGIKLRRLSRFLRWPTRRKQPPRVYAVRGEHDHAQAQTNVDQQGALQGRRLELKDCCESTSPVCS